MYHTYVCMYVCKYVPTTTNLPMVLMIACWNSYSSVLFCLCTNLTQGNVTMYGDYYTTH